MMIITADPYLYITKRALFGLRSHTLKLIDDLGTNPDMKKLDGHVNDIAIIDELIEACNKQLESNKLEEVGPKERMAS